MIKKGVLVLVVCSLVGLPILGCQGDASTHGEKVLLRYSPQVGGKYVHKAELVGYATVTGEMEVEGKEDQWYQVEFAGPLFGQIHTVSMEISDRHNCTHPGYLSLNFPDDPVAVGDEWGGEIPWYYESRFVLDETPIKVPSSYRLVDIEQGKEGRYAVIEQIVDVDVVVYGMALHIGQLGVRWDGEGRITEVHPGYDAEGKIAIGDVLVGINGQDARTEQDRNWLAEEHIQHPKESRVVALTVLRDGREVTLDIEKSIDEVARVRVEHLKGAHRIEFDLDRGILLSAEMTLSEDIQFSPPSDAGFPIVDSYGGYSKFGYLEGRTAYQESRGGSGVAWRLTLEE
jgi:hypothetical protein